MAKTTQKADTVAAKEVKETKAVEEKDVETKAPKAEKAPKAAAKKPAAKKAAPKAAAKKPAAAKAPKASKAAVKVVLEYRGVQVNADDVVAAVKAAAGSAKSLEIYVKPEDGAAYYVADGVAGKVDL